MEVEKPGEEAPGNVSNANPSRESVAVEDQAEGSRNQSRQGK